MLIRSDRRRRLIVVDDSINMGTSPESGLAADWGDGAFAPFFNWANTLPAVTQSGQPFLQTNASAVTRPSATHWLIVSESIGPYWPPERGQRYQQVSSGVASEFVLVERLFDFFDSDVFAAWPPGVFFASATVEELAACTLVVGRVRDESLESDSDWSGIVSFTPHSGQIPRLPAKNDLTFS